MSDSCTPTNLARPAPERSHPALRRPFVFRGLLVLLGIAPAIWTAALINRFGVNVPYWDDWENTVLVHITYLDGRLTPLGLFYQESDSRPALPRLILLISTLASDSNRRVEMFISLFVVGLTSLNIYLLARRTVPSHTLWIWSAGNWLLFSPVQYENWLWGVQLLMFLPIWLFTSALLLTLLNLRWSMRVGGAIALWILAALCFVSGFFFWPLLGGMQFLLAPSRIAARWTFIAWTASLAITAALYFHNFKQLGQTSPPELVLLNPEGALQYFTAYFASAFRITGMLWMQIFLLGALVLIISLLALIKLSRDKIRRSQWLPWAAIACYAVITGLSTTLGRLGYGIAQSQSSRYTTFSLLLPLAAIALWTLIFPRTRKPTRYLVLVVGALLFGDHLVASVDRLKAIAIVSRLRNEARLALHTINLNDRDPVLNELHPQIDRLKLLANEYAKRGGIPPLETNPSPR